MPKKFKNYLVNLLVPLAMLSPISANASEAAFCEFVSPQQAVEEKKDGTKTQQQNSNMQKVKVSGLFLNTTKLADVSGTLSSSMTFLTFPNKSELWLVGGQNHNQNGTSEFDVGLKYFTVNRMVRGTVAGENDIEGKQRISAGMDWDAYLASYKSLDVSVLGDVSTVGRGKRHTDYGVGTKLNFSRDHNAFFLYSNRGTNNISDYRTGYMFWNKDKLAAVFVDNAEDRKPSTSGFYGAKDMRFILTYDAENCTVSSNNILAFGNQPLPEYATRGLLANQFILTKRSVSDSDALHFFQPTFFATPRGKVGDIFRLNASYDTKSGKLEGFLLYNVLMVKLHGNNGILLTQNANRENDETYYGFGVGYKFGRFRMAPLIRYQTGGREKGNKRITVDLSLNY